MRITCDGRMRRFSGRAQRMEAEIKRDGTMATIRVFRAADAAAATAVLRESVEAANWLEKSYVESLGWRGAVALASEVEGRVTGFVIGRQIADEGEILNLAVALARRRRGEGGALLKAALEEFRARRSRFTASMDLPRRGGGRDIIKTRRRQRSSWRRNSRARTEMVVEQLVTIRS